MLLAKIVNTILRVLDQSLRTLKLNVREYDANLQINKTPAERMFIWLRIIGVAVGVLVVLSLLVFLATKI